jgi:hypothetical protein
VNRDFGIYEDPDSFYRQHGANLTGIKGLLFRKVIRHRMNRKVVSIRGCALPTPKLDESVVQPVGLESAR